MLRKLVGIFIIISLSVVVSHAQSQQLPQNVNNPTPKQEGSAASIGPPQAGQHQERATNQEQVSPKSAVIINQDKPEIEYSPTQKSKNDKNEELKIQRQLAKSTKTIADFTIALVAVTTFLGLIAIGQGWIANKAAIAAKESADALKDAERAHLYVFVRRYPDIVPGYPITNIKEGYNVAKITAMNCGKTPAIIVKFNHALGVFTNKQIDDKLSEMKTKSSKFPSEIIVVTQEKEWGYTADCNISAHDEIDIGISVEYACFGRIDYRDVFGTIHEMTFCWKDNGVFFIPDPERCSHT